MNHPQTIYGMPIVVVPDAVRALPDEVMPGVPWPPGFKQEIDAWMRSFFKPRNLVPDGQMLQDRQRGTCYMNPRTWEKAKQASMEAPVLRPGP